MNQLALSLPEGRRLKREGMALVAGKNRDWLDLMLSHLVAFAWARQEFTVETFRAYTVLMRLPKPTNHHAWGALSLAAMRAGLIKPTGRTMLACSARTHAHPIRIVRAKGIAYG